MSDYAPDPVVAIFENGEGGTYSEVCYNATVEMAKSMKKLYSVYRTGDTEKQRLYLTEAQAAEYRRNGYYVTEV